MFQTLTGIYEASAIQQLPDGRFLVVEDEQERSFSLVTLRPDGSVATTPLDAGSWLTGNPLHKLDDLEGVAIDRSGFIHAISSHSRDADGDEKKSRGKAVRFRIEGDRAVDLKVVTTLKPALTAAHPVLARAAAVKNAKADSGFNIEALEASADAQRLLIGFRSPLEGGRAIIASVENPAAIFETDEAPRISASLDLLDLGGNGIRGMSWIPTLDGYLIIGGPASPKDVPFELWFWSGDKAAPARRVTLPGLPGFERAEGVCPAVIDGIQRIVIVSDDGNRKDGRFARFLLLDPGQLQIAP